MLFDTDVLIWAQRGNSRAAAVLAGDPDRRISLQTSLELIQGARNKQDQRVITSFVAEGGFSVMPLTENIGHRALVYLEEFALGSGMEAGDAIIAATAVEHGLALVTANLKHYRPIRELKLRPFRPTL